jgi:hypothetical protein
MGPCYPNLDSAYPSALPGAEIWRGHPGYRLSLAREPSAGSKASFHAKQHSWSARFRPPRSLGFANPSRQDRSPRTSATTRQKQDDGGPEVATSRSRITNISASRSDESGPTPAARRLRGLRRVGVGSRSNHAAIFQLPDLTLVPFDLRTAPLFGCDLVQEGHNSVIASIDQRSRCRRGVDTG